jgi:cell division septation protein DedD
MRKSSAEHATQHGSGFGSGRGLTRGARLRPSEDNGRPSMTTRRGNSRGWEIRLGALQVVVWLGLAIGAVFGAYFIGFFSGRYVGFETARTASGVEVPKLALNEEFPEKNKKGWDDVYGQLGGAAVVGSDEKKPAEGVKAQVPDQRVVKAAQEGRQEVAQKTQESESGVVVKRDAISDPEAIFNQDLGGTQAETEGASAKDISGKGGEVRVLGRESALIEGTGAEREEVPETQKPTGEIAAKVVAPKKAAVVDEEPSASKVAKVTETKKEKVAVVKRLPKGYFSQVAAPKTKAEAEELSRRLRKSGFPVIVEDNSTGRSPFYRVMVGPEVNKVQADRMLGQLKREKYLDGKIFIRQVK